MRFSLKVAIGQWKLRCGVESTKPVVVPEASGSLPSMEELYHLRHIKPTTPCDDNLPHDFTHWTAPEEREVSVPSFMGVGGTNTSRRFQSRTCTRCNLFEEMVVSS